MFDPADMCTIAWDASLAEYHKNCREIPCMLIQKQNASELCIIRWNVFTSTCQYATKLELKMRILSLNCKEAFAPLLGVVVFFQQKATVFLGNKAVLFKREKNLRAKCFWGLWECGVLKWLHCKPNDSYGIKCTLCCQPVLLKAGWCPLESQILLCSGETAICHQAAYISLSGHSFVNC